MKISVIIPCFNHAHFVGATLESVCNQPVDDLEVIVVDGGSTDGSQDVIKRYNDKINVFISEPDKGQYDAINKGMAKATGDIQCWLNSDDILLPGALSVVQEVFDQHKDIAWICDMPAACDLDSRLVGVGDRLPVYSQKHLRRGEHNGARLAGVQQEGTFWRREIWAKTGGLDLRWKLAADFDLWTRMAEYTELVTVKSILAAFRLHPLQRGQVHGAEYVREMRQIAAERGSRTWANRGICAALQRLPGGYSLFRRLFWHGTGKVLCYTGKADDKWNVRTMPIW